MLMNKICMIMFLIAGNLSAMDNVLDSVQASNPMATADCSKEGICPLEYDDEDSEDTFPNRCGTGESMTGKRSNDLPDISRSPGQPDLSATIASARHLDSERDEVKGVSAACKLFPIDNITMQDDYLGVPDHQPSAHTHGFLSARNFLTHARNVVTLASGQYDHGVHAIDAECDIYNDEDVRRIVCESTAAQNQQIESHVKHIDELTQKLANISNDMTNLQMKFNEEQQSSSLYKEEIENLRASMTNQENQLSESKSHIDSLTKQLKQSMNAETMRLNGEISKFKSIAANSERSLTVQNSKNDKLTVNNHELSKKTTELKQDLKDQSMKLAAEIECKTRLVQQNSELDSEIERLRQSSHALHKDLESRQTKVDELQKQLLAQLQHSSSAATSAQCTIDELRSEKKVLQSDKNSLENTKQNLTKQLESLQSDKQDLEENEMSLTKELENLQSDQKSLTATNETLMSAKKNLEKTGQDLHKQLKSLQSDKDKLLSNQNSLEKSNNALRIQSDSFIKFNDVYKDDLTRFYKFISMLSMRCFVCPLQDLNPKLRYYGVKLEKVDNNKYYFVPAHPRISGDFNNKSQHTISIKYGELTRCLEEA